VIKEANATVQEARTKSDDKTTEKTASESPSAVAKKSGSAKASKTTGEALEIIAKIKNITQKSGETNGKPWTKYNIESVGGTAYTTFDKKFAEAAATIKGKDKEALLIYVVVDEKYFNLVDKVGLTLV
jgi:hypothetical protein